MSERYCHDQVLTFWARDRARDDQPQSPEVGHITETPSRVTRGGEAYRNALPTGTISHPSVKDVSSVLDDPAVDRRNR